MRKSQWLYDETTGFPDDAWSYFDEEDKRRAQKQRDIDEEKHARELERKSARKFARVVKGHVD